MAAISFSLLHFLAFLVLTATVFVAGRLITGRLEEDGGEAWERFGVAVALGLGLFGQLGLILGLCGILTRGVVIGAVVAVHLAGLGVWKEMGRGAIAVRRRPWIAAGLAVALGPVIVLSFYPPVGFDETLYHLPFARAFARTGGVPFLPDLRVPVFPQLGELVFAEVLLLADDVAVHGVELLATAAAAALLSGWARRVTGSREAGWLAAGIWLGNPIVAHLAGTAYLEPGLALFAAAALYAHERWREDGSRGWLTLAAAFAGAMAASKYLGLIVVGLILLLTWLAAPRGRKVRGVLLAALVAAAVAGPWYARILYYTGNPVFPFFGRQIGRPSAWDGGWVPPRPLAKRVEGLVRLPWSAVFARKEAGNQPPHSPVYLLGLPLLVLAAWRDRRVRRLLGAVLAYALLFLVVPPDARYLVALLPLLSLALALAVHRWVRHPRILAALALAAFLPGWLYAGYRLVQQGPVPATAGARDRYLADHLPVWPAIRFLNRTHGSRYTVYAFHAENMMYLAEGRLLGEWAGPARFSRIEPLIRDPAALHRELRELGAGFLLVPEGRGVALPYGDPAFRSRFRRVYADGASEVFALRSMSK